MTAPGLLGCNLPPITYSVAFVHRTANAAVDAFVSWMNPIELRHGRCLEQRAVHGTIETLLRTLLPVVAPLPSGFLFLPARSGWTAVLDNFRAGMDAATVASVLSSRMGCAAVRATVMGVSGCASEPCGVVWEVWGSAEWDGRRRSVSAVRDGARWVFDAVGEPFAFEEIERYSRRNVRERLNAAMVGRYLEAMGIRAFEREHFAPEGSGILVKRHRLSLCLEP